MELDIIILPKSSNESQTQLELKQKLVKVLEKIYDDVQKEILQITINSEKVNVNYRISAKNNNMLFEVQMKKENAYQLVEYIKQRTCTF